MRDAVSLKRRLLLSLWLLLVLGILLPFWFYHGSFNREIIAASRQQAMQQLNHLSWLLEERNFQNMEELQGWLSVVGRQFDMRLTFIGMDGRALADSQLSLEEIAAFETLSTRPEFVQAISGETGIALRYSKVSGNEQIFGARKISFKDALPHGIFRIAIPFGPVKSQLDRAANGFTFLLAFIFIATILISWALNRRLKIPVAEMSRAVDAIGAGDYSRRVPGQDRELYPLGLAINRMADNLGKRLQRLSGRRQHLEAVFEGMQEGVMVLNPKGRIIDVNRAFCELVAPRDACMGRNPLEVVRNLEFQEACERILAGGGRESSSAIEIQFGRDLFFSVNIVRLSGQAKDLGAIVVFHEISRIKRLEKIRQDFVANVSRELKAPLVAIQVYAERILAEGASMDEKTRSLPAAVLKETGGLLDIVRDLLQLASLESSPVQYELLSTNPAKALNMAWDECRAAAVAKEVSLESDLPQLGIEVAASSDQLTQVFRNLLANAINYSPEGGLLTVGHSFAGQMVVFSIRDEGPGIPVKQQERIFERFYRAGKRVPGKTASSGLGLAICKHIVQNHGGSIWVQSPNAGQEGGATFFFSVHLAESEKLLEPVPLEALLH